MIEKARHRNLMQNQAGGFYFVNASREGIYLIVFIISSKCPSEMQDQKRITCIYREIPREKERKVKCCKEWRSNLRRNNKNTSRTLGKHANSCSVQVGAHNYKNCSLQQW